MTHAPPASSARSAWDTTVVRALAAILIANSHSEALYPRAWMAADGMLGNSIFFLVSGLGLTLSARATTERFPRWYAGRILRIYPSLWITLTAAALVTPTIAFPAHSEDWLRHWVWPTRFGYIESIMVFYAVGYILRRVNRQSVTVGVLLFVVGVFGCATVTTALALPAGPLRMSKLAMTIWQTWFFGLFLLGSMLPRWHWPARVSPGVLWVAMGASLGGYIALKYLMVVHGVFVHAFVLLFACVLVVTLSLTAAGARRDMLLGLLGRPIVGPVLFAIGGASLEIYLTHGYFATLPLVVNTVFPMNIGLFIIGTVIATIPVHMISSRMQRAFGAST